MANLTPGKKASDWKVGDIHIVFGGTFDPVHCGHLAIAKAAAERFGSMVYLLPAAEPAHRPATAASAAARLEMARLAARRKPWLAVDTMEVDRGGPSFAIDSVRELRARLGPARPIAWLIGADAFSALPSWHMWRQLFDDCHFIVAARGDDRIVDWPDDLQDELAIRFAPAQALCEAPAGRIHLLEQALSAEAATPIRVRIAAGTRGWRGDVVRSVADYIDAHGLYR